MIDTVLIQQPVGIIHPARAGRKMKKGMRLEIFRYGIGKGYGIHERFRNTSLY